MTHHGSDSIKSIAMARFESISDTFLRWHPPSQSMADQGIWKKFLIERNYAASLNSFLAACYAGHYFDYELRL